jgi:uncharacterized Ntn-hydrolase superfamily protein
MNARLLSLFSLLVALGALGHSIWLQNHSRELAAQALREREKELVRAAWPNFRRVYSDMLGDQASLPFKGEPETLPELLKPMLTIIEKMQGSPGSDEVINAPPADPPPKEPAKSDPPKVNTFSIVACDPATGELGVAVQSKYFGVGSVVPWAEAGVGAVATQSYAKMGYGPDGLKLMREGKSPREALDALLAADPQRALRQIGFVDAQGRTAAHTGAECNGWAGHREGKNFTVEGNLLAGEAVVTGMADAFEKARAEGKGELADWLMAALRAAQEAGGDKRGQQSAALLIVRAKAGPGGDNDRFIDLRVEDHEKPIEELGRLLDLHKRFYAKAHQR